MQIDGQYFAISAKHGVPANITERFWAISNQSPDLKFDDVPEDLMAYHNASMVASLNSDDLRRASTKTLVVDKDEGGITKLTKRQGLPS